MTTQLVQQKQIKATKRAEQRQELIEVPASGATTTKRVTTTYQILAGDDNLFCDTDGGAFTATLPVGADGHKLRIINCGGSGNLLTIAPTGAELLVGANASKTISDGTVIILVYEPTEGWW